MTVPFLNASAVLFSAVFASTAFALPNGFAPGGNGPNQVLSAQLGIDGPASDICPTTAAMTAWVIQTEGGPVQMIFARRGQGVGAPIMVATVKMADGRYMATFTKQLQINGPIDAEYRLLVGGGSGTTSNWVSLATDCSATD